MTERDIHAKTEGCGGLVFKSRLHWRRFPGFKPYSTDDLLCMLTSSGSPETLGNLINSISDTWKLGYESLDSLKQPSKSFLHPNSNNGNAERSMDEPWKVLMNIQMFEKSSDSRLQGNVTSAGRGGLVVRSQIWGRRAPGSNPDTNVNPYPSCIGPVARYPYIGAKRPPNCGETRQLEQASIFGAHGRIAALGRRENPTPRNRLGKIS
ncbi:hypothetical protein AVEN_130214-1 [Araneus ventricosus]|uniref:Uncharacterized protein n=1 Tax=Araneus ventricosus TaxID=182803 RepID=A0A4Y2GG70_ARAVE|nr:hypothetical protein AVEN_130214-1 [Araneus ventricosus]